MSGSRKEKKTQGKKTQKAKKVVVRDLAAEPANPKGGSAVNNPLYKDSGMSGMNPLFKNA